MFYRRSGPEAVIPLEDLKTVTSEWYQEVCLPRDFGELNSERSRSGVCGILFHQDNEPAHTAARSI